MIRNEYLKLNICIKKFLLQISFPAMKKEKCLNYDVDLKIYKITIQFRILCVTLCFAFAKIAFLRYPLRVGLSVCWVSKLCLSVCLSEQVMFGMGFVCLSV